ncbi:MAG TPA: hypothetical protein VGL81_01550 [Polyangiaceae bacterium]
MAFELGCPAVRPTGFSFEATAVLFDAGPLTSLATRPMKKVTRPTSLATRPTNLSRMAFHAGRVTSLIAMDLLIGDRVTTPSCRSCPASS